MMGFDPDFELNEGPTEMVVISPEGVQRVKAHVEVNERGGFLVNDEVVTLNPGDMLVAYVDGKLVE